MEGSCEFCKQSVDPYAQYLLVTTKYWRIYLADQQNYPGRCFIPLNRHCKSLPELTDAEWKEFHLITKAVEAIWRERLHMSCGNWACLMNGAYAKEVPDPHVHFHFVPRYRTPVSFGGMEFVDERYGDHYEIEDAWALNLSGRAQIVDLVKEPLRERLKEIL